MDERERNANLIAFPQGFSYFLNLNYLSIIINKVSMNQGLFQSDLSLVRGCVKL